VAVEGPVLLEVLSLNDVNSNPVVEGILRDDDDRLPKDRQTSEEEGRQLQVRQISRLIMVFLSGRQVREAFTS